MKPLNLNKSYGDNTWKVLLLDYEDSSDSPAVLVSLGYGETGEYSFMGIRQARAAHRWLGEWLKEQEKKGRKKK